MCIGNRVIIPASVVMPRVDSSVNDTSLMATVPTDRGIKVWEINLTDAPGHS